MAGMSSQLACAERQVARVFEVLREGHRIWPGLAEVPAPRHKIGKDDDDDGEGVLSQSRVLVNILTARRWYWIKFHARVWSGVKPDMKEFLDGEQMGCWQ